MNRIPGYPKIYNLGHAAVADLLLDDVVVEEKIDGSQWSFRLDGDGVHCRSKGKQQDPGQQERMFDKAVETVERLESLLNPGWAYRTEFLLKPKHNTLAYDRVPRQHLILFDVDAGLESYLGPEVKRAEADRLGLDCVPVLLAGKLESYDAFAKLLETVSVLGGQTVEGVVVKNYCRFGTDGKALMGKFVSEKYKEIHAADWKGRHPGGAEIRQAIGQKLRTEARWHKAVQHLREDGRLTGSVRDIGPLIKEVQRDVTEECEEMIKDALFHWARGNINRVVIRGFAEWYKEFLARRQFDGTEID